MNKIKVFCFLPALLLSGCGSIQKVTPVDEFYGNEVCVIENKEVRDEFLLAYKKSLTAKGYDVNVIPGSSKTTECAITSTYVANWNWDIAMYMRYAEIKVYNNGNLSGRALYDAHTAVFNKFINAENKINELTDQLFYKKLPEKNESHVKIEKTISEVKNHEVTENKNTEIYSELMKFNDLKKAGIITDEEFNTQKARILSGK